MKAEHRLLIPILGYHGCDATVAQRVLSGREGLLPSDNDYDWLGPGIYFWIGSPEQALYFAREQLKRGKLSTPAVVGALIHPARCLNLTDYGALDEVRAAYDHLVHLHSVASTAGHAPVALPENAVVKHGVSLMRRLDCAVIRTLHQLREEADYPPYDAVFGIFEEDAPLYPGAGFKRKTHVQIAVRNLEAVVGYFRPA